jgi:hypothetical protein
MRTRAAIALRSLSTRDRDKVVAALERLQTTDFQSLLQRRQLYKLHQASETGLYVLRATNRLRVIVSKCGDALMVEDIMSHDRLDRLRGSSQ